MADRIARAFRYVLARRPTAAELETLRGGFERHLAHYRQFPQEAESLVKTGEAPLANTADTGELAAYTVVASLILNLDAAVTKE